MADRAFRQILLLAIVMLIPLALALALTLVPGQVQRALHGYDVFVQTCLAALYGIGQQLPPLGLATLALTLASVLAGAARAFVLLSRTRALTEAWHPAPRSPHMRVVAARLGLADRVGVFRSPLRVAFTAGLARPRVWISSAAIDALAIDELEAVLLHERRHLLRRDPLRIAVVRLISSLLFFVPLVDALRRRFEVAKELDADRDVLLAQRDAAPLAGALARLGIEPHPTHDLAIGAWSLVAARIDQLEGADATQLLPQPPTRARLLSGLAFAGLLLLAVGQAMRANVVPAAAWELAGAVPTAAVVCPVPLEGPLF